MRLELPDGYVARPYRGTLDHPTMAAILGAYHRHIGDTEIPTAEQFDVSYANLANCDPATDIVVIETAAGEAVGYARTSWEDMADGERLWVAFAPLHPDHLREPLYRALLDGLIAHRSSMPVGERSPDSVRVYGPHPGPGRQLDGEPAWLESMGFRPRRFAAALVRPNLDDIPVAELPAGVEIRRVEPHMLRQIFDTHHEAFRGQWDFHEMTDADFRAFIDNPLRDESLWKIAWAGDQVVGQVKSYINASENESEGRLRGYTEEISTVAAWRGRGVARALIVESLHELRRRGMQQAALAADTDNPQAFELYQRLGYQVVSYEAVYDRPIPRSG